MEIQLHKGDNLGILKTFEANSVDSIVTDPPYGLGKPPDVVEVMKDWIEKGYHDIKGKGFMGKEWDAFVPQPRLWKECLRVLKPGGHLLTFSGTRTQDWMGMSLRFAGFEIRDSIAWVYGSGFPKNHDISKQIDKKSGAKRKIIAPNPYNYNKGGKDHYSEKCVQAGKMSNITAPSTEFAKQWEGWGTALKPALEPIIIARKPASEKSIAENVLKWGTGAINIDESRIDVNPEVDDMQRTVERKKRVSETWEKGSGFKNENNSITGVPEKGRFPANLIHDGSEEVRACFPESKSTNNGGIVYRRTESNSVNSKGMNTVGKAMGERKGFADEGNASRFFKSIIYQPKAGKKERNLGLEDTQPTNVHPTVKPLKLMTYLVRLITPKGGTCLDPYMGSGTTGLGCVDVGVHFKGIDSDEESFEIAQARIYGYREKQSKQSVQTSLFNK